MKDVLITLLVLALIAVVASAVGTEVGIAMTGWLG